MDTPLWVHDLRHQVVVEDFEVQLAVQRQLPARVVGRVTEVRRVSQGVDARAARGTGRCWRPRVARLDVRAEPWTQDGPCAGRSRLNLAGQQVVVAMAVTGHTVARPEVVTQATPCPQRLALVQAAVEPRAQVGAGSRVTGGSAALWRGGCSAAR